MCNFENILRSSHFSIAIDMLRITHFLAEIMDPKNSASTNFLTFPMSGLVWQAPTSLIWANTENIRSETILTSSSQTHVYHMFLMSFRNSDVTEV